MEFLSLVASITQRRAIASEGIPNPANVAPFANEDVIDGVVRVVQETFDPTNPTTPYNIDSGGSVTLTDGAGKVYATGTDLAVASGYRLSFKLSVTSDPLTADLAAAELNNEDHIDGFFEVRIIIGDQDILLLREPCIIWNT